MTDVTTCFFCWNKVLSGDIKAHVNFCRARQVTQNAWGGVYGPGGGDLPLHDAPYVQDHPPYQAVGGGQGGLGGGGGLILHDAGYGYDPPHQAAVGGHGTAPKASVDFAPEEALERDPLKEIERVDILRLSDPAMDKDVRKSILIVRKLQQQHNLSSGAVNEVWGHHVWLHGLRGVSGEG